MAQRSIKDFFGAANLKAKQASKDENDCPPRKKFRSSTSPDNEKLDENNSSLKNGQSTATSTPTSPTKDTNIIINKSEAKSKSTGQDSTKPLFAIKDLTIVEQKQILKDVDYDPNIEHYNPLEHSCWKQGEKVSFLAFANTLGQMEQESGRLKKIAILSNFFWSCFKLSPEDLIPAIYLVTNRLAPDYEGIELGLGETLIMKAIANCSGRSMDQIKNELRTKKDLGLVAESSVSKQKLLRIPPPLMLRDVFQKLRNLSSLSGNRSQDQKIKEIQGMLHGSKGIESRFLVRLIGKKLSICFGEASIQAALAQAITLCENEKIKRSDDSFKRKCGEVEAKIKTAYCQCPNFERILQAYFEDGLEAIEEKCSLTLGIPLKPMLAHAAKGIDEVFKKVGNSTFTCEYKYDGERAQIHFERKRVADNSANTELSISIYSRNQENNTSKYPDIISRISSAVDESVSSFILDCEAVAWDLKNKQILPFQVLSTRKRKDAKESEITVQVCLFAFDILQLNGESLIANSLRERRKALANNFKEIEGEFFYAQSKDLDQTDEHEVMEFFEESLKGKCEGLMIKTLDDDATYEIAKRSHKWLKLKKDYVEGLADTLDLLVIGAFYGKGKRSGSYGGYLLACYDEDNEEYQAICKLGTGFKDEDLEQQYKFFENHIVDRMKSYYQCDESIKPDVWFEPVQVWEIKCADISLSPVYKAAIGLVDENKGISLRFPRFVRIRDDKKPEQATNSAQVAEIYRNQEIFKSNDQDDDDQDDD